MVTRALPARDDALRLLRERFLNRTDLVAILAHQQVGGDGDVDLLGVGQAEVLHVAHEVVLAALSAEARVVAALFVDAWRIGQPLTLQRQHRLAVVGVNGVLCAPRDIAAIVDGLRRILGATADERAGLGAGGSDLVRARYDSSGYAAAYRKLLRGLLRAPRAFPGDLLSR
jgi:hypothetical protein